MTTSDPTTQKRTAAGITESDPCCPATSSRSLCDNCFTRQTEMKQFLGHLIARGALTETLRNYSARELAIFATLSRVERSGDTILVECPQCGVVGCPERLDAHGCSPRS